MINISKTSILGDQLYLREWKPTPQTDNSEAVILLHGIESHSEWFIKVAELLVETGYAVLAYDRAGWGKSEGRRGHLTSYSHALKQLTVIAASLRKNQKKIHLVGLSWGGMFALYATLRRRIFFDSISMIVPGIYPATSFSAPAKIAITTAIIAKKLLKDFPLPIHEEDFTSDPHYLEYIRRDPLRTTAITAGTAFETLKMQQFCKETTPLRQLPPATLLLSSQDRIIRNNLTRELLQSQEITIEEFPGKRHSLVFEDPKRTARNLITNFAKTTHNISSPAKILIMGAGAVGSIVGGYLALGGNEVTLIGRKKHVSEIKENGLCISLGGVERLGIREGLHAVENIAELNNAVKFDLVILTVKSYDTPKALTELFPAITEDTTLLSLQNGVGNEPLIHTAYPHNTLLAGIICMNLNFARPGCIICTDDKGGIAAGIYSGKSEDAAKAITALRRSGLQVDYLPESPSSIKWSKLLLNISSNVLNAITGQSYKEILSDKFYGNLAVKALQETLAIMKKEQIEPVALPGYNVAALARLCKAPDFIIRRIMQRMADDSENTVTSMQQDLKKIQNTSNDQDHPRHTELTELNGKIVKLGKKYSIPTPANAKLCELLQTHLK